MAGASAYSISKLMPCIDGASEVCRLLIYGGGEVSPEGSLLTTLILDAPPFRGYACRDGDSHPLPRASGSLRRSIGCVVGIPWLAAGMALAYHAIILLLLLSLLLLLLLLLLLFYY